MLATPTRATTLEQPYSEIIARQQAFFATGKTRDVAYRKAALKKLLAAMVAHEPALLAANKADFGRPEPESYAIDLGPTREELKHTIAKVGSWAKPSWNLAPLHSLLGTGSINYQPYGVTLIIGAWNYPYYLALGPLIAAIAAGNTVVLKPSEMAPEASKAMKYLLADAFDPEYVAVVEGGPEETTALLSHRFDYIFYTGSTRVGKIIMQAAVENLTAVTLELGGKSPCIVDRDCNIDFSARRIVWGKFINAGQTCVAPDYLLVDEQIVDKFTARLKHWITQHYGIDPQQSPDYARIINQRHHDRLTAYLNDGKVAHGGRHDRATNYLEPTLLTDVDLQSPVMQEEIFGPVLPILTYRTLDEAIKFINGKEHPLALYVFTERSEVQARVMQETRAGGGCLNDCVLHLADPNLPFGGVGMSGMGQYHGKYGFQTFSHARSLQKKTTLFDLPFRYPPYTKRNQKLTRQFLG